MKEVYIVSRTKSYAMSILVRWMLSGNREEIHDKYEDAVAEKKRLEAEALPFEDKDLVIWKLKYAFEIEEMKEE